MLRQGGVRGDALPAQGRRVGVGQWPRLTSAWLIEGEMS